MGNLSAVEAWQSNTHFPPEKAYVDQEGAVRVHVCVLTISIFHVLHEFVFYWCILCVFVYVNVYSHVSVYLRL